MIEIPGKDTNLIKLISYCRTLNEYDVSRVVGYMYKDLHAYSPEKQMWFIFKDGEWMKDDEALLLKSKIPSVVFEEFRDAMKAFGTRGVEIYEHDKSRSEQLMDIAKSLEIVHKSLKKESFQNAVIAQCKMALRNTNV